MTRESRVTVLLSGVDHAEGVAWDPRTKRLIFGTEGGLLRSYDVLTGDVTTLASNGGFLLGVTVVDDGAVLACDPENACVWRWQPGDTAMEAFLDGPEVRFPNFILNGDNGSWVSDSGSCWDRADGTIWRVEEDGRYSRATEHALAFPNGLALSSDQSTLFCLESYPPRLLAFQMNDDGKLSPPIVVLELPGAVPDGMLLLPDGRILVACYRPDQILILDPSSNDPPEIYAADPHGRLLAGCANLCFFGSNLDRIAVSNVGGNHISELHGVVTTSSHLAQSRTP